MDSWLLYAIMGYIAFQISICIVVSRFIKSESDYLLAGRSLGIFLATASLFASWFGSETVLGASGAIAEDGLSGSRSDPIGYSVCLLLMGLLIASAMRSANYVTVGDFFMERYGRRNEVLAALIMVPTSILWAAAQIQAFGIIMASASGIPLDTTLIIAVCIVIAYTWLGGMLGDVITDVVQGIIVIIGLFTLLAVLVMKTGGITEAASLIKPEQLSLLSSKESWLAQANVWAIPILGSLVAPEALSRTLATKNADVARKACFWSSGVYLVVGCIPVMIALIGTHLIPPVAHQDMFLPTLVKATLPGWMSAILLGALVSAILSVIDTTLLSISGLISHNIILNGIKSPINEKKKLLLTRFVVMLAGLTAYAIATRGDSIHDLVETASSFGSAGFLVCVLGGLFLPSISALGATVVLLGGVILSTVLDTTLAIEGAFLFTVLGCSLLYLCFWRRKNAAKNPKDCV